MAISQDDFSITRRHNYPGMLSDNSIVKNIDGKTIESGELGFGDFCIFGASDNSVIPFDGVVEEWTVFAGVVVRHFRMSGAVIGQNTNPKYSAPATVHPVILGRIWVTVEEAVTRGFQAVISADNKWYGGDKSADASGAGEFFDLQGAVYLTSAEAGKTAELELTGGRKLVDVFVEPVAP